MTFCTFLRKKLFGLDQLPQWASVPLTKLQERRVFEFYCRRKGASEIAEHDNVTISAINSCLFNSRNHIRRYLAKQNLDMGGL
jgi:predicted DNA-binding protein YlxM (UPF0122 family)